jgi:hypothetical protein
MRVVFHLISNLTHAVVRLYLQPFVVHDLSFIG